MRWWCWQPAIEVQDIFIYSGASGFEPDEDAAVYSGFHIEHAQAGGFMTTVLISTFGGDASHVLRSFIRPPSVISRMTSRLQRQGILLEQRDAIAPLQLTYTACQKRAFAAVAPLVRYEYRLAHLVALESSDLQVRRLKAQLAVFLTLKSDWNVGRNHDAVVSQSWGWGRSFCGDLWKVFGMWKVISRDCQDFETVDERPVSDASGVISLSGSAVSLFRDTSVDLETALNNVDKELDVGLLPQYHGRVWKSFTYPGQ
ncbi:hypothetical protein ACKAV7_009913 [Fusarium commune]